MATAHAQCQLKCPQLVYTSFQRPGFSPTSNPYFLGSEELAQDLASLLFKDNPVWKGGPQKFFCNLGLPKGSFVDSKTLEMPTPLSRLSIKIFFQSTEKILLKETLMIVHE